MNTTDGSYFVQYVFSQSLGINISKDIKELINEGFEIKKEELLPGDLVFTRIDHVGIYIGNNEIIHYSDGQVQINKITNFYKGRRIEERINNNEYINNFINNHPDVAHGEIIFQIKTPLEQTDENWEFLLGDYNNNGILDLYCIKKKNTKRNTIEVHILDGNDNFQSYLLRTTTPLNETGDNWQFLLGDYNQNKKLDLYCIKKNDTWTNSTEVYILDGNNDFKKFVRITENETKIKTALHETGDNFQFLLGDYNNNGTLDLYCIKKSNTGTNSTEVHILDGKNDFQFALLQIGTPLPEVGDCYVFQLEDYNNDGKLDLYCIKKFGTESNSTEISIISGNDNFQSFIEENKSITKLSETDKNYSFYTFKDKLYIIYKKGNDGYTDVICLKIK
jgi:hypothetical protein